MTTPSRRRVLRALGASGLLSVATGDVAASSGQSTRSGRPIPDRLGSTHVAPGYSFSTHNVLNEGARRLRKLGSRVIKVWFHRCAQKYPQHSDWPEEFDSMVDRATHPYFRELFEREFRTFILSAYREQPGDFGNHYFRTGITDAEYDAEVEAFADVTRHLLETYDGTGKEFVLQHWQGDWAIIGSYDRSEEPSQEAIDGMIRWLQARQEGVRRARRAVDSDVTVLHGTEVNIVLPAMFDDERRVVNEVLPETTVDLVSHNSYDEMFRGFVPPNPNNRPAESTHAPPAQVELMQRTLSYVNDHAPEPNEYVRDVLVDPSKNVFVGEYGFPEVTKGTKAQTRQSRRMTQVALEWGAPWVVYWQLYDNEEKGYWLVRADESTTPTYDLFADLLGGETAPAVPTYVRLDLDWSHQIDKRAFACSAIELRTPENTYTFDVGVPLAEPIFWTGAYWVGDGNEGPLRWFGGDEARTTMYVRADVFGTPTEIRLRGYPKTGGIEAALAVDGGTVDAVELTERRWDWWSFSLPTATATSTPTEERTTADSNEGSTATTSPDGISSSPAGSTTDATGDGLGAVAAVTGIGLGALALGSADEAE